MARETRHEADVRLLDRAAALFARHGFDHTSIKDVADAVGLSKAGLLHHYPTKDALFTAAAELGRGKAHEVAGQAMRLPAGPERDRAAIELMTDLALEHPGLISMAAGVITEMGSDSTHPLLVPDSDELSMFAVFDVDPRDVDSERLVRVIGALSALAVLSLAANHVDRKSVWRRHIVATCLAALGHPSP
ncbi:TetR/AcrR family transcriptional regulator [Actinosynnema pretiosum subsp. pretiosum]|uniref:TetR/AcrR family transcriptional regulator n=1 Tax=Actinosynnema pretiosum subsp. pretiosum TaxID=103721 RepID=A0AA45L9J1_9PSEU|nr:TetR/AcrR family transcriptional regulator [Actinosynnema mirum]AXX30183.1 Transcriptional regulator, TetR family [Actinosynnema pretiosum subsp. pretiosum]QUF05660.1 TetR/AcrR family transcriptional regulator [Actinosynnema pretiosum subsp. pretiosum]